MSQNDKFGLKEYHALWLDGQDPTGVQGRPIDILPLQKKCWTLRHTIKQADLSDVRTLYRYDNLEETANGKDKQDDPGLEAEISELPFTHPPGYSSSQGENQPSIRGDVLQPGTHIPSIKKGFLDKGAALDILKRLETIRQ
ncbi:hypothetical protein BGX26_011267 [Mortierella sp. AD094]|nr:hypothetical protein BGX26_011267 [Mortierella sp. AD094]